MTSHDDLNIEDCEKVRIALKHLPSNTMREAGRRLVDRGFDAWEVARTVVQLLEGGFEIPPPASQFEERLAFFQRQLGLSTHPWGPIPQEMFFATEAEMLATGKFVSDDEPERRDLTTLLRRVEDFARPIAKPR